LLFANTHAGTVNRDRAHYLLAGQAVWQANMQVYGADKVWHQINREPERSDALIHHSDRGSQYVSILYTERLAEAGIEPSVGSRGDSYDNALAETINGLYKAELIHRRAPWKTKEALELATLEWVAWFNHHRLLSSIGYIPPAEAEVNYYRQLAGKNETEVST